MWPEDGAHEDERAAVRRAVAAGRLAPALLVSGEAGLGKRAFGRWLAAAALCAEAGPPCGDCPTCRKVRHGRHPDVDILARGKDEATGEGSAHEITVDQVRTRIVAALGLRPLEGRGRVVIVDGAEDLNVQAQNALLKSLEEPPAGSRLVLVCSRPDALLPTVRSRCQTIRLAPGELPADGVDPLAHRLARGRPGQLERFARLPVARLIEAADGVLVGGRPGTEFGRRAAEVVAEAVEAAGDDEASVHRDALAVLHARVRDLFAAASGAPPERLLTPASWPPPSPDALRAAERALLEAGEDLRRHLPYAVVWAGLGVALADAAARYRGACAAPDGSSTASASSTGSTSR